MKKNTFFAIVAMLMMTVSALAQSNSYNMVIEMTNGTKICIGPNDVKNISFNEGALVISGETIEQIAQANSEKMKEVESEIADLKTKFEVLSSNNVTKDVISDILDTIDKNDRKQEDRLYAVEKALLENIYHIGDNVEHLTKDVESLQKDLSAFMEAVDVAFKDRDNDLKDDIGKLREELYDFIEAVNDAFRDR